MLVLWRGPKCQWRNCRVFGILSRNLGKSECNSIQSPFPALTKNESALGSSSSGIARSSNLGYESREYDSAEWEFMYRHRPSALLSHQNERGPRGNRGTRAIPRNYKDESVRWRIAASLLKKIPEMKWAHSIEVGGGVMIPGFWGAPNPARE